MQNESRGIDSMKNQKSSIWQKKNVKWILLIEMIFMGVYALAVVTGFSAQELVFEEDEMKSVAKRS